jgi:hypothetical protein
MTKLMPSIAADGFAQSERYSRAGIYAKPPISRAGGCSEIEAGMGKVEIGEAEILDSQGKVLR